MHKTRADLGAIAQLGERLLCKQEVVGSIPSGSTKSFQTASSVNTGQPYPGHSPVMIQPCDSFGHCLLFAFAVFRSSAINRHANIAVRISENDQVLLRLSII
jgi:hypothetical protein